MLPKGSIAKVYEYYFTAPQFKDEVLRALREFFNRPDLDKGSFLETNKKSEGFFNEWFLYDFILSNGQTVLENFIATNPFKLKDKEMELYRKLLNNKYGIFEVIDLKLGKSITLKDLQTGKQWFVQEYKGTFSLKKGFLLFGRIGEVSDHYELIGADSFMLEGVNEKVRKYFRNKKFKFTPKEVNEVFNR